MTNFIVKANDYIMSLYARKIIRLLTDSLQKYPAVSIIIEDEEPEIFEKLLYRVSIAETTSRGICLPMTHSDLGPLWITFGNNAASAWNQYCAMINSTVNKGLPFSLDMVKNVEGLRQKIMQGEGVSLPSFENRKSVVYYISRCKLFSE